MTPEDLTDRFRAASMQLPQYPLSVQALGPPGQSKDTAVVALRKPGVHPPVGSLYVHMPFCSHKCHYCDFYSFVDTRDQQAAFVDRLVDELRALGPHAGRLKTVFIGGGTPSLLGLNLWERVLGALRSEFDLSGLGQGEFTVECNPETTTRELCDLLAAGGVNRVSVGAQSFAPRHLKTLERWHQPENVERAIERVRGAGISRQSVDLIFAIPGQTLEDWSRDLERAVALGTEHLSCYALTFEPNTAMTRRLTMGEFARVDEDLEADMFELTARELGKAGLARYEVSNFARVGAESLHNLAYWRQSQWLAAGPSASGHVLASGRTRDGSWRWKNVPRLGDYLASDGFSPATDVEGPDPLRFARERIMMGLRLSEGLGARALLDDLRAIAPAAAERLCVRGTRMVNEGWLTMSEERWTLTEAGLLMCDGLAGELMACVREAGENADR